MIESYDEIEPFYTEGFLTSLLGNKGNGKTDYSLLLSEAAIQVGHCKMLTNILCQENKNIRIVTDDVSYLENFVKIRQKILLILDETGVFANSKEANTYIPRQLEKFILMMRHFRTAIIFINQREFSTLPVVRDLSNAYIWKTSKKTAIWEYEGRSISVRNIRATDIPFQTYSFAAFSFKLDWTLLFNQLSSIDYNKAILKMKEILANKEKYYSKWYRKELKQISG